MKVANSVENVANGICQINNDDNFEHQTLNNIPCTRYGKKINSQEINPTIIDQVIVGNNDKIIKGIEVGNYKQHLQLNKSDHVLLKIFINEKINPNNPFISKYWNKDKLKNNEIKEKWQQYIVENMEKVEKVS